MGTVSRQARYFKLSGMQTPFRFDLRDVISNVVSRTVICLERSVLELLRIFLLFFLSWLLWKNWILVEEKFVILFIICVAYVDTQTFVHSFCKYLMFVIRNILKLH